MTTIAQARESIYELFKTGWDGDSLTQNLKIFYDKKEEKESDKSADKAWSRITIKHSDKNPKNSLPGSSGQKIYNRTGIIIIDLFTPLGNGADLSDQIIGIVLNIFEGNSTSNGVWFKNVRFKELGSKRSWDHHNVIVEFEYSERK